MRQPDFAQDLSERFEIVTFDGRPTGIFKPRAAVHRDGDWHRSVHIWVVGVDEHGPFVTFQRRSLAKDTWPGRLDATVGGHVRAGEGIAETLREAEEEIGISVTPELVYPAGIRICVNDVEPGTADHEVQSVFLLRDERPLSGFSPNPAELAGLVRIPVDQLLPFFAGERAEAEGIGIDAGQTAVNPVQVTAADFVMAHDRYHWRVALAARAWLAGERYVTV